MLIGGFRFDHGQEILAPLHQAMAERGAEVRIFVDIQRAEPGQDPNRIASAAIEHFYAFNWPFGPPRPELFYDPETVVPGAQTSLHAKCLVVDRRFALVSSANFTDRGLTRNLEAGGTDRGHHLRPPPQRTVAGAGRQRAGEALSAKISYYVTRHKYRRLNQEGEIKMTRNERACQIWAVLAWAAASRQR